MAALDELTASKDITDIDRARINKSTLDRLLEYKDSKAKLNITRNGDSYSFGAKAQLKKAVLGLRDQKVDRVYTAKKGKEYLSDVISGKLNQDNEDPTTSKSGNESTRSRRTKDGLLAPFGGGLSLKSGAVNNLYRDIESLFYHYAKNRKSFTESFIVIFRMSLRVLAETAANEASKAFQNYLKDGFDSAKKGLDKNLKTTLANQNIKKDTIVQLLQTGAHDYHNSKNEEQALALSIILGRILLESHGRAK